MQELAWQDWDLEGACWGASSQLHPAVPVPTDEEERSPRPFAWDCPPIATATTAPVSDDEDWGPWVHWGKELGERADDKGHESSLDVPVVSKADEFTQTTTAEPGTFVTFRQIAKEAAETAALIARHKMVEKKLRRDLTGTVRNMHKWRRMREERHAETVARLEEENAALRRKIEEERNSQEQQLRTLREMSVEFDQRLEILQLETEDVLATERHRRIAAEKLASRMQQELESCRTAEFQRKVCRSVALESAAYACGVRKGVAMAQSEVLVPSWSHIAREAAAFARGRQTTVPDGWTELVDE